MIRHPPSSPLFPYSTLFRAALTPLPPPFGCLRNPPVVFGPCTAMPRLGGAANVRVSATGERLYAASLDRKSTRLNSSHANISHAVFCLKKKMHHERLTPK